jgi:hypothetical protein
MVGMHCFPEFYLHKPAVNIDPNQAYILYLH